MNQMNKIRCIYCMEELSLDILNRWIHMMGRSYSFEGYVADEHDKAPNFSLILERGWDYYETRE